MLKYPREARLKDYLAEMDAASVRIKDYIKILPKGSGILEDLRGFVRVLKSESASLSGRLGVADFSADYIQRGLAVVYRSLRPLEVCMDYPPFTYHDELPDAETNVDGELDLETMRLRAVSRLSNDALYHLNRNRMRESLRRKFENEDRFKQYLMSLKNLRDLLGVFDPDEIEDKSYRIFDLTNEISSMRPEAMIEEQDAVFYPRFRVLCGKITIVWQLVSHFCDRLGIQMETELPDEIDAEFLYAESLRLIEVFCEVSYLKEKSKW